MSKNSISSLVTVSSNSRSPLGVVTTVTASALLRVACCCCCCGCGCCCHCVCSWEVEDNVQRVAFFSSSPLLSPMSFFPISPPLPLRRFTPLLPLRRNSGSLRQCHHRGPVRPLSSLLARLVDGLAPSSCVVRSPTRIHQAFFHHVMCLIGHIVLLR